MNPANKPLSTPVITGYLYAIVNYSIKEPSTNVVLIDHVTTKKWQQVVDFDDHLDDISKFWSLQIKAIQL
jgi:hypothetical protein